LPALIAGISTGLDRVILKDFRLLAAFVLFSIRRFHFRSVHFTEVSGWSCGNKRRRT
jgi:hypothetical protein